MLLKYLLEFFCDLADCLIPAYAFKLAPRLLHRVKQPVRIVLVISDVQALSAGVSFADRAVLVRADFDNTVVFNFDFKAAADSAHYAGSLLPFFHDTLLSEISPYNIQRRSSFKKILFHSVNPVKGLSFYHIQFTLLRRRPNHTGHNPDLLNGIAFCPRFRFGSGRNVYRFRPVSKGLQYPFNMILKLALEKEERKWHK
jgi:hypothetical protein